MQSAGKSGLLADHNNRPVRQQDDKKTFAAVVSLTFYSEKWISQKGTGVVRKILRFQCADLYVVKGRHEVGSDFCRFLFRYGVGGILFTGLKDVLKRTAILGRPRYRNSSIENAAPA
jgi:hypothetical protein